MLYFLTLALKPRDLRLTLGYGGDQQVVTLLVVVEPVNAIRADDQAHEQQQGRPDIRQGPITEWV